MTHSFPERGTPRPDPRPGRSRGDRAGRSDAADTADTAGGERARPVPDSARPVPDSARPVPDSARPVSDKGAASQPREGRREARQEIRQEVRGKARRGTQEEARREAQPETVRTYQLARPERLDLETFARATGTHPELVRRLVVLGVLDAWTDAAGHLWLPPSQLLVMARIRRLRAGFSINYAAIGLVLDLLDRIADLEAAQRGRPRTIGGSPWT
ncbi:chaperone modulator CbpM [Streptosporangium sp. NPDC002524]|uniref:chaperone modulator CbpM n=1 Tax=Streptosporangium sp. NPDC002524 TaxID=3154537 RepID=UPI00332F4450